jgi:hypothetical protein
VQTQGKKFMLNFSNEGQNDREVKKTFSAFISRRAGLASSDISGASTIIESVAESIG